MRLLNNGIRGVVAMTAVGFLAGAVGTAEVQASQYRYLPMADGAVMIIRYDGKAPYERRIVARDQLTQAQLAQVEAVEARDSAAADEATVLRQVTRIDRHGKPPFAARTVMVREPQAYEFARFEEVPASQPVDPSLIGRKVKVVDRTGKPPFSERIVTITEENAHRYSDALSR